MVYSVCVHKTLTEACCHGVLTAQVKKFLEDPSAFAVAEAPAAAGAAAEAPKEEAKKEEPEEEEEEEDMGFSLFD